ncbi:IclR family transcriptional regulator [Pseudomonas sp. M30-35]|uniref:IclR family transcriptional regulator n=1 Tax=Pseudomonas sp. M30-35 TaxID=1981174 RepID=UPI000B3C04F5|nr:IclR family transcriptional regulator C-terminal domain-containing protein [Pseudomonas sp. M30-35]ARU87982.1 transcriptional regulator [Pseudomonas sp. M30-35]
MIEKDARQQHAQFIETLEKGVRVLEVFRNGQTSIGLTELAHLCHMSKSAAQRFTHTWCELGYLAKDEHSRRYRLTHKALELGFLYLHTDPLISRALPALKLIRERCNLTVNLSVLSGHDIVYVMRIPGPNQTFAEMLPGRRMPAWSTSAGRVLLSALPDEQIRASLASVEPVPYTAHTELDRDVLFEQIVQARKQGYAFTRDQVLIGQLGLAAPIRNVHFQAVAAVNITAHSSNWSAEKMQQELVPLLMEVTQAVSVG